MEKIKAIIIDDEKHSRTITKELLSQSFPEIEIVGEGDNLPKAVELIYEFSPNLVFLDIEMPNYSGLQINDFIKSDRNFEIVFITAYNQFAIEALRISAFDYLLKPIQLDELEQTIIRFKEKLSKLSGQKITDKLEVLSHNLNPNVAKKLVIQTHQGIHYFEINKIYYLEASGMYTVFHLEAGQFVASKPLKDFEDILGGGFFRIHRSYIVNCSLITVFSNKEGGSVTLNNGTNLPISRNRKEEFLSFQKNQP